MFYECMYCSSQKGSPVLCDSCLGNRATITRLEQEKEHDAQIVRDLVDERDELAAQADVLKQALQLVTGYSNVVRTTEPCEYCSGWKNDGSTCSGAAYTDTFSCEKRGG